MDVMRIRGPVARGVATGTSSHAAGTAALAAGGEEGAAAVSGRGLHSSAFQLNVSVFRGIAGALGGNLDSH
jgi:putative effector of murein hydrolase